MTKQPPAAVPVKNIASFKHVMKDEGCGLPYWYMNKLVLVLARQALRSQRVTKSAGNCLLLEFPKSQQRSLTGVQGLVGFENFGYDILRLISVKIKTRPCFKFNS